MNNSYFHEFAAAVNHSIIERNYDITNFRASSGIINISFNKGGQFFSATFSRNTNNTWTGIFSENILHDPRRVNNPYELLVMLHDRLNDIEQQQPINNGIVQNNPNIHHGGLDF